MKAAFLTAVLAMAAAAQPNPWIRAFVPADGATGVPLNVRISLRFGYLESYHLDPVLLKDGVVQPGKTVFLTWWAVFTPDAPLQPNSSYEIRITNVGYQNGVTYSAHFTTGGATDNEPPVVEWSQPESGQDGANYQTPMLIRFNKPLDPALSSQVPLSLTDFSAGYTLDMPASLDDDGRTLRVQSPAFSLGHSYRIAFPETGIAAWTGVPASALPPLTFRTSVRAPTGGPRFLDSAPANGEQGVPLNSAVLFRFDRPLTPRFPGAAARFTCGSQTFATELTAVADAGVAVRPTLLLPPGQSCTVSLSGLTDVYGGTLPEEASVRFDTGSLPDGSTLTASIPYTNVNKVVLAQGSNVRVRFNRALDPAALALGMIGLAQQSYSDAVRTPFALSDDHRSLTLTPAEPLVPGSYDMVVSIPYDRLRQTSSLIRFAFSIAGPANTEPPALLAVSPADGTTEAPLNTQIDAVFNRILDVGGAAADTVQLTGDEGPIAGTLSTSVNAGQTRLTFRPKANLAPSSTYRFIINGLSDYGGRTARAVSGQFHTAAANPSDAFQLLSIEPANGAVVTDPMTPVRLTFNRNLSPVAPALRSFLLLTTSLQSGFEMPAGHFDVNGPVLTFTPEQPLAPGEYGVSTYYVADLAGNPLPFTPNEFTVAASAQDASGSTRVLRADPGDGAVVNPLAAAVLLTFDRPIQTNSISRSNLLVSGPWVAYKSAIALSPTQVLVEFQGAAGSLASVSVTDGVLDYAMKPVEPFSTTVRLGPIATAGKVVRVVPSTADGLLDPATGLSALFDTPVDPATVEAAAEFAAAGKPLSGRFTWTPDRRGVTFQPDEPMPDGAAVAWAWAGSSGTANVRRADPGPASSFPDYAEAMPTNAVADLMPGEAVTEASLASATCRWTQGDAASACTANWARPGVLRLRPNGPLRPRLANSVVFIAGSFTWTRSFLSGTGPAPDDPRVEAYGPVAQDGGVPLNAGIELVFTSRVSALGIRGGIRMTAGGQDVPLQFWPMRGRALRAAPMGLLQPGTDYTVTVSGLEDVAGHPFADLTWSFQTSNAIDTDPPTLLTAAPSTTNASPRSVLTFLLNEQWSLAQAGDWADSVGATLRVSDDRHRVEILPPADGWSAEPSYDAFRLRDIAGNDRTYGSKVLSFFPGHAAAETVPVLITTSPGDSQDGVPLNVRIEAKFDAQVLLSQTNATLLEDGTPLAAQLTLGKDGRTAVLTPQRLLRPGVVYDVRLEGIRSAGGAAESEAVAWQFRTGASADLTAPAFTTNPTSGAAVPADRTLRVRFSEPMKSTLLDERHIRLLASPGALVAATVWVEDGGRTAVLQPQAALSPLASYKILLVNLEDLAGNPVTDRGDTVPAAEFYVGESGPAPVLLGMNPPDGSTSVSPEITLLAVFDRPVDLPLAADNVRLYTGDEGVPGVVRMQEGRAVVFTPNRVLAPGSTYRFVLSGLRSLGGDPLPDSVSTFTVEAGGAYASYPGVLSTNPRGYAANVPVDSLVTLTFTGTVSPAWVQFAGTVTAGGAPVPGAWTVDDRTATFRPALGFPPNSTIVVGGPDYAYYSTLIPKWSPVLQFTTGAAATGATAALEASSPADGALVPAGPVRISLRFSGPVYPPVNGRPFHVIAGTSELTANISYSEDGRTLATGVDLPADRQIVLSLDPNLIDLGGQAVRAANVTFRTMNAEDSALPAVKSVTPGPNASNVAVTEPVVVEFTQPMDPASVPPAFFLTQTGDLVAGAMEADDSARKFRFTPTQPLGAGRIVRVDVDDTAHDPNGWYVPAYTSTFATAQPEAPASVVSYSATPASIDLKFSGPVDTDIADFALSAQGRAVAVDITQGGPDWLRLTPETPLTAGTTYRLRLASGPVLAITPESAGPNGALAVDSVTRDDDGILLRFNQPVNPVTLDRRRLRLLRADGSDAPYRMWIAAGRDSVRLIPGSGETALAVELDGIETPARQRLERRHIGGLPVPRGFRPAPPRR